VTRDRDFANSTGPGGELLAIAPARHPDRSGWRSALWGIAYLAFLATMPLTRRGRPGRTPARYGPPPMTRHAAIP